MIKKTPKGYYLYSLKTGRKFGGPYRTKQGAINREQQIRFFKIRQRKGRSLA